MEDNKTEIYKVTMRKILRVSRLHRMVCERDISKMGIHHSQHHLLMYIAKQGEITSQKEIAERFGITPAAVARSLKSLENEGFVERTSLKDDGRFNKIRITDKGKEVVATIEKDIVEYMSRAREGIPEENMLAFYGVLQSLENNISLIAYDEQ